MTKGIVHVCGPTYLNTTNRTDLDILMSHQTSSTRGYKRRTTGRTSRSDDYPSFFERSGQKEWNADRGRTYPEKRTKYKPVQVQGGTHRYFTKEIKYDTIRGTNWGNKCRTPYSSTFYVSLLFNSPFLNNIHPFSLKINTTSYLQPRFIHYFCFDLTLGLRRALMTKTVQYLINFYLFEIL